MHRCLQNPDVLLNIFESLSRPLNDDCHCKVLPAGFAALASLARTCKIFQTPAIRALWKEIPGLYVIAYLFPRKSVKMDRAKRYSLVLPLDFDAFSGRLSVYRPYVKVIWGNVPKCEDHTTKSLHSSFLFLLLECTSVPTPLFPHAHHVIIPCLTDAPMLSLFYPPLVLGPSVCSIILNTDDDMVEMASSPGIWHPSGDERQWEVVQSVLLRGAPRLHSFAIYIAEMEAVTEFLERPQIDLIVQRLSIHVTNIDLSTVAISSATIIVLSSLPVLSSLNMVIGKKNCRLAEFQHPSTLQFPSLNTLRVVLLEELDRTEFLAGLCAPLLQKCTICVHMQPDNEDVQLPLDGILGHFFQRERKPLTRLIIRSQTANRVTKSMAPFEVTVRTMRYLSKCPKLITLTIGCFAFSLQDPVTDNDLIQAFSCWKKLEFFDMNSHALDPLGLLLTPEGVRKAIKACPSLYRLALPCDFRVIPNSNDDSEPHPSLERWNVYNSPIDSATDVGHWLDSNFPLLEDLEFKTFPRDLLLDSRFKNPNIWRNHKEDLITLAQWIQVPRIILEGAESDTKVDD
ncbi:hypothetical protein BKA70DRAFT_1565107 [Coprinopsis sp. MPI-PUGE-AT-0042]|nr:hypothetical protein BKA70DRAFT_1565107 [Coprinopsis sp. MPI-PUGE-AT-0042]